MPARTVDAAPEGERGAGPADRDPRAETRAVRDLRRELREDRPGCSARRHVARVNAVGVGPGVACQAIVPFPPASIAALAALASGGASDSICVAPGAWPAMPATETAREVAMPAATKWPLGARATGRLVRVGEVA